MGDAKKFKNGRQSAACLGLIPKEYSSGGRRKPLGIGKRCNTYMRKLLILGAAREDDKTSEPALGNSDQTLGVKTPLG